MASSKVKKGDPLLVNVPPAQNNGDAEAVGFVVGVNEEGEETLVNVKVLLDGDANLLLRNVPVLSQRDAKKDDAPNKRAIRL